MARENKRGLVLSFKKYGDGSRGRWYTRIGGKPQYFGWGNGVTDKESYDAALRAFEVWKGQQAAIKINAARAHETAWSGFGGMRTSDIADAYQMWGKSIAEGNALGSAKLSGTLGDLLDIFLEDQTARNKQRHFIEKQREKGISINEGRHQNISDSRFTSIRRDVETFRDIVGEDNWDGTAVTATKTLDKFRKSQTALLFAEKIKPHTFDERIKLARMFTGWAEMNDHLDRMPKKSKELFAKFTNPNDASTAKAIPLHTLRILWKAGDARERAFICLGLNFGYYSKDISDLTNEQIDGDYVNHVRRKTGVKVRYKMWAVTKKAIEATRTQKKGRVYLNGNGNPLNYYPEGKCRVDICRNDFYRLCEKCHITGFSFSNLRDTSTTHIDKFNKTLSDLFDAHVDKRMAAKYIDSEMVDTTELDAAIDHLEELYRLDFDEPCQTPETGMKPRKTNNAKKGNTKAMAA